MPGVKYSFFQNHSPEPNYTEEAIELINCILSYNLLTSTNSYSGITNIEDRIASKAQLLSDSLLYLCYSLRVEGAIYIIIEQQIKSALYPYIDTATPLNNHANYTDIQRQTARRTLDQALLIVSLFVNLNPYPIVVSGVYTV